MNLILFTLLALQSLVLLVTAYHLHKAILPRNVDLTFGAPNGMPLLNTEDIGALVQHAFEEANKKNR